MSDQKCGPLGDAKLTVPDTATFKPPEGSCLDKGNDGDSKPKGRESGSAMKCLPQAPPCDPPKPKENDCEKKCNCDEPEKGKATESADALEKSSSTPSQQGKCSSQKKDDPEKSTGSCSGSCSDPGGREYCACSKSVTPIPRPSVCGCGSGEDFCGPNVSCEVRPLKMKQKPVIGKLD